MAKAKPITNLDVQAPTRQNAVQIVQARLTEMYEWSNFVDSPYAIRELHNLRIAAKRLRYTLAIFADFLPGDCKPLAKELQQLQDELGALHDSDVLIALLRLCLGSQENPITDPKLLTGQKGKKPKTKSFIRPELLAAVLDPSVAPTPQERDELEQFLREQEQKRQEHYQAFRQHWYRLQEQDFRRHLLTVIGQELVTA
jgi:hypothetical protein